MRRAIEDSEIESYSQRVINGQKPFSNNYESNEWREAVKERVYNNFTRPKVENINSLKYPWSMIETEFNFYRLPNENIEIAPSNRDLDRIYDNHWKKLDKRKKIISGMDIGKVKTFNDSTLKTSQSELNDIKQKTMNLIKNIKMERDMDQLAGETVSNGEGIHNEENRAYLINNGNDIGSILFIMNTFTI